MAATVELLIAAASGAAMLALAWRMMRRRVTTGGSLDSYTVSREWLLRHSADDRS